MLCQGCTANKCEINSLSANCDATYQSKAFGAISFSYNSVLVIV